MTPTIAPGRHPRPPRPPRSRQALWAALTALAAGCVLDPDDRCGPGQVAWDGDERCVCAEGTAYTESGCVPCGEHEVSSPNGCVCDSGYARAAATGACASIPEGIGTPCSSDAECLNPSYAHCEPAASGAGYCTAQNCGDALPCEGGYACNTAVTPSYCQRPPTGAGQPCTSDAECAGTDALFCDLFVSGTCLVRDCTVTPNSCFSGFECCDLSGFGLPPVCLLDGLCQE